MITINSLTYAYPGAQNPAVRGIDFSVQPGEIFGFLGPSGAGKSTTQNILIRLLKGYQGEVSVLGKNLEEWGSEYYERVGVSFEFPNHYLKLTALENLEYFRSLYSGPTEDPQRLLDMVGLGDDAHKRVGGYSKGMRGRLNIARSLIHKPELLFLDEPTSGLDPVSSRRVRDLVRTRQQQGTTVFLTTHNMSVADELCDRVAFIIDGEIRLIDSPRRLKLQHGKRSVRVEYSHDGQLLQREYGLDGLADDSEFLDTLRHYDIQTIHTQETTLEDIFIAVTGRSLS
jgi:fluoroquinolone transport system ATP-binding protein